MSNKINNYKKNKTQNRNLKTSNVLVDEQANAKLSDINILSKYKLSYYSAPEVTILCLI